MRHGSLFSGIGGFDLAAEWMGWENVFHCEWNPFGQKILKYYWPNAKSYGDITKTDFRVHRRGIDVLSGGFPCQPLSQAGKQLGAEDPRYLFPQMLRAIREIKPRWVVAENVFGITSKKFKNIFAEIYSSLEAEGYSIQTYIIPASAVNAPHERDRVWFVAHSNSFGFQKWEEFKIGNKGSNKEGYKKRSQLKSLNREQGIDADVRIITDTKRIRQQRSWGAERQIGSKENGNWKASWTYPDDRWPTVSPVRGGNDGFSTELVKQCLEGLGNAIVPQIAFEIFKAIESYANINL